ncbi:hypothetical protein JCM8547_007529 [Rhodosporidiobolus lusitaniae]
MSSRSSRIPRSAPSYNENAATVSVAITGKTTAPLTRSRIPSASSLLSSQVASTNSSSARPLSSTGAAHDPTPAYSSLVGIALQLPTSDPALGETKQDEKSKFADEQMPTPPNSHSPPPEEQEQDEQAKGKGRKPSTAGKPTAARTTSTVVSRLPRSRTTCASASSSQLAPPAPKLRRSSRSPSAQQAVVEIPAGPSHAPHVLAARRRSSVSPLPPPAASTSSASSSKPAAKKLSKSTSSPSLLNSIKPEPASISAPKKPSKRSLRPRPSETLPAPISLNSSDSEADDPILLLGPEQTRGKGEGKAGAGLVLGRHLGRHLGRGKRGTPAPRERMRRVSEGRSAVEVAEETEVEVELNERIKEEEKGEGEAMPEALAVEQEQEEDYGGGYDAPDAFSPPAGDEQDDTPSFFARPAYDEQHQLEGEQKDHYAQYGQTDAYAPLVDASSGSEADPNDFPAEVDAAEAPVEQVGEEVEQDDEDDPSDPEPLPVLETSFAYSHTRNRGGGRPSYPPLSAEVSGEWDSEVPLRLGSESPVKEMEQEQEGEEAVQELVEGQVEAVVEEKEETVEEREEVVVEDFPPVEQEGDIEEHRQLSPSPFPSPAPQALDALSPPPPVAASTNAFRSPSPAVFSPFFRRPSPSLAFASPVALPRGSTPSAQNKLSIASPRLPRQLHSHLSPSNFPSPAQQAIPIVAVSPAPPPPPAEAPASAVSSSRTWTRGPAFFRSSSFSPPPHADQPRSATLYARYPGRSSSPVGDEGGEAEKSREYHRFADLTPTSPHVEEIRELRREVRELSERGASEGSTQAEEGQEEREQEQEDEEEEEEEVVLVGHEQEALERARSLSRSLSPPPAPSPHLLAGTTPARKSRLSSVVSVDAHDEEGEQEEEEQEAPPTPAKDFLSSHHSDEEDERMSSPVTSLRSPRNSASPPRSPAGENILMSSPSPVRSSFLPSTHSSAHALASPTPSASSSTSNSASTSMKKLPPTPLAAGAHEADEDARMASPSPVKRVVGEVLERGRERIKGLLFSPSPRPEREKGKGKEREEEEEGEQQQENREEEEDEDDQPFPEFETQAGPSSSRFAAVANESLFTAYSTSSASLSYSHSHSHSNLSTASRRSSTSRRRSRPRPRPSHPTLPIIEISSSDPRAAARAAAILKCYHDYIEQGVEHVDALSSARREFGAQEGEEDEEGGEDEEEELRTLLVDAEEEVRKDLPRRRSESIAEGDTTGSFVLPSPYNRNRNNQLSRPSTSSAATSAPSTSAPPPVNLHTWTSTDWRRLEHALVEVGRRFRRGESVSSVGTADVSIVSTASAVGEEVEPERVVEVFLGKVGVGRGELSGAWEWNTLLARVQALKTRRAKDFRLKHSQRGSSAASSSFSSAAPAGATGYARTPLPPVREEQPRKKGKQPESLEEELRKASSPAAEDEQEEQEFEDEDEEERSPSPVLSHVKTEQMSEYGDEQHEDEQEQERDFTSDEEDDESRNVDDDTFFGNGAVANKDRRRRRSSVQPVYLPTALSNPKLRHIFDDTPPEKPKVPLTDYLRDDDEAQEESPAPEGDEEESRARETITPEQDDEREPSQPPSSAQRLFSYLGSFVRRSPAPEPDSPSSVRAAAPTSRYTSPDAAVAGSLSPVPAEQQPEMQEARLAQPALVTPRFASTSKPFPPIDKDLPHPGDRKILPFPPSHFPHLQQQQPTISYTPVASSSKQTFDDPSSSSFTPRNASSLSSKPHRRRSSGEGRVSEIVNAIEEAESSREEEEARIVELLQSGRRGKRRAVPGDLRSELEGGGGKGKGKEKATDEGEWRGFVEIERDLEKAAMMVPAGTRALDRRPSGELRATRR